MRKKAEFHIYLIRTVILAFISPILLFLILLGLGIDARLNMLACIGIFAYLMISVSLNTIKRYSKKSKAQKKE